MFASKHDLTSWIGEAASTGAFVSELTVRGKRLRLHVFL
jgi:hypothetical protein